jgi:site-specific DNA-methyltransferase (adenine-specific)
MPILALFKANCLEKLKDIPDKSVDLILTDPPYGTTTCRWDIVIPFDLMWAELKRIVKDGSAIIFFSHELFSAQMMLSNKEWFSYSLVWAKSKVGRFAQAKLRFLNTHEDILVFSNGKCSTNSLIKMKYYPQGLVLLIK